MFYRLIDFPDAPRAAGTVVATVGGITLMQTGKEIETMIIVLLTYLMISMLISGFMNWYNKKMALVER